MSTILIKDTLRQSIEAASGGAQTVIYTAKGQPTYMNIIEKYDMSTLGISGLSGTHPAFIVNGVEKDKILIGTYQGALKNGELVSQPNAAPTLSLSFNTYLSAVRANGAGHHLITGAEWAAVALQAFKSDTQPLGNSYYGRSTDEATQYGRRVDGLSATAGTTTGSPQILTGSGTVKFRHNQKYNGISDMAGNAWEHTTGVRIHNGEFQIMSNNNAAISTIDLSATSSEWKAIDGETGALITPDGNGTTEKSIKIGLFGTAVADYKLILGASSAYFSLTNPSPTKPVSSVALTVLKRYALCPAELNTVVDLYRNDAYFAANTADGVVVRGGAYDSGNVSGIFATAVRNRTINYPTLAARPTYYTP